MLNWSFPRPGPELTSDNWALVVLSKALIFRPNKVLAIESFEPTNGEMTASHVLKMFDKRVVHGSAAQRTEDWKSLRRDLLRHHHSKAGRHLRDEADAVSYTHLTLPTIYS